MPSVDGLVTGIDTADIIDGLLSIQQRQLDLFQARKAEALQKQAAVRTLDARLASLQSLASQLGRAANNPLVRRTATTSDESALIATASSTAATGTYSLTVETLAQAHQVASQGYANADAAITQGTIEIRSGSAAAVSIEVTDSNDTLQGLADAINGSGGGVSATIVRDAAGGATPYRLLLTADETGADHAITVNSSLAAAGGIAAPPEFDFDQPVQAAQNATISLGSGTGSISVESATNEFRNVISGVTLNALQADPGQTILVRVEPDVESAAGAVEDFVASFNEVLEFIDQQTAFNPETDQAGLLTGNRIVTELRAQLTTTTLGVVAGANPRLNRLSAIGVSVTDQGRLELDSAKLKQVLSGREPGVTTADVRRLFALDGQSTNPGIRFLLGSSRTQASATPYQVDITQAAASASLLGTTAVAGSTSIEAGQDTLQLTIDGVELEVGLQHGTYTAQELASEVERAVNAHPDLGGREVRVGAAVGGELTLTTVSYGSASHIEINGGDALGVLGLSAGQTATGINVAGRFLVDGKIEIAVGQGRTLTGDVDNEHTADLRIQVNLIPDQVDAGIEGQLTVTQGVASGLFELLGKVLASDGGRVQNLADQYQSTVDNLDTTIGRQQSIFEKQQEALQRQFAAMEAAISQLQSTAAFLGGQLAALSGSGRT
ncbi:MAG: flagellar filament capping protein FliD [Planctomycetaceae bacterium]|nr:flagellar filament capping protein FliD [Planctomycetaceae bacterium]